ncbi:hypothetical protein [Entomomonas asaccharolytica]|uniref:B box-type domain-containing protein n=1 Tax=Entomomonas asaccharolytica TaxID=2785331 RepID=A0A974RXF7_9GAMM|nr:hypothetical protein [Entomomonas asaccharolytica]QQP84814.1 hypothetical protein JHT90_10420 [Entomomonas asaccharolytica]
MNCYQHHSQNAIGICKSCGKALCSECAVDLNFALTCKGACEKNAKAAFTFQKKTKKLIPLLSLMLGITYIFFGFHRNSLINIDTIVGCIFFIVGIFTLLNIKNK